ncbi:protein-tyrosine phosphatase family protein [Rhabdothermincola salaria]|uniref:protein-tyrosine phosphatase family protein n=1 Tax=Rhabdothermincola salaria TaxID=2903142 RepID=UPI001E33FAAA|nr:hypothetical protein [Rhabdothermincola salaria]MCD9624209.1 hypothetical protein [Rhabdothermincola salaria]
MNNRSPKQFPSRRSVDAAAWHRRPGEVCEWLVVCGDLHHDLERAVAQLADWDGLGVTRIVDVREEWSDEELVASVAPHIAYHHLGTHDAGDRQPDKWWDAGLAVLAERRHGDRLLVHCHMGVNRGPSMAFRLLLADGWRVTEALDAIRAVRPIAAILYADSALVHHVESTGMDSDRAGAAFEELGDWFRDKPIDVAGVISRIRRAA